MAKKISSVASSCFWRHRKSGATDVWSQGQSANVPTHECRGLELRSAVALNAREAVIACDASLIMSPSDTSTSPARDEQFPL